jgi:hypothetical protein
LVYEHGETGDVFLVPDPGLRLDELESVQNEVANLLRAATQQPQGAAASPGAP